MKPKLPKYSDDEVESFHPVFKYCAEAAINAIGMEHELIVEHHRSFSGITVDYSIANKSNNKIVLLVEIKRTISAVESTRYRHQALSYRKEADHLCQTKYYILTNLEQIDLFRYDPLRPRVSSQLIKGSPYISGSLKDDQSDDFLLKLTENIKSILDIVLNDTGHYDENLDILHGYLSTRLNDQQNWHKFLMPFSYEYIRGSAVNHTNLNAQIQNNRWKAADSYMNQPKRLSDKGSLIDFELVFKDPITDPNDTDAFNNLLLHIAFSNGKNRGKAEDISEIIYDVLSLKDIPGIVETDEELAKLLALIAKDCLNRDLTSKEFLADPAAGSGRLITSAVATCFTEISANNIWANEIESLFMEALSLRIGLCFANTISINNTPKITLSDISELTQEHFENVKVILLNPPYISGIYSKEQRKKISKAINIKAL